MTSPLFATTAGREATGSCFRGSSDGGLEGPIVGREGVPAIGRWKMLDNLRRSLSAPAIVLALIAGWAMPLEEAAVWTGFILSTIILPPLISVMAEIAPRRPGVTLRSHVRAVGAELRLAFIQSGLMIVSWRTRLG